MFRRNNFVADSVPIKFIVGLISSWCFYFVFGHHQYGFCLCSGDSHRVSYAT